MNSAVNNAGQKSKHNTELFTFQHNFPVHFYSPLFVVRNEFFRSQSIDKSHIR